MRVMQILAALAVVAILYAVVFERDAIRAAMGSEDVTAEAEAEAAAAPEESAVSVVALRSAASVIDNAVILRGRTEAARTVDVRAETSGKVISEPLRKGATVAAGDLLCRIDEGTRQVSLSEAEARLAEARAGLPTAEARLIGAQATLNEAQINDRAAAKLSEGGFASETRVAATTAAVESARAGVESAKAGVTSASAAVQAAEAGVAAAEKELDRTLIHAPFDGLLETDSAELGALLQPGTLCATVIKLDPIKLVGFVPETTVGLVRVGAMAGGRLANGKTIAGKVTFLSRSADPNTRTFRVEIEVPNPDLAISDGQTAEIAIDAEGEPAHLLPQSALTLDDEGALGVRVVENAKAAFRPVKVLRDTTEGVWVAGLGETADVIVTGQEFVTDGVPVAVTWREAAQ